MTTHRQGDILLIARDRAPEGLVEVPRRSGAIVLAEGEATGHLHKIESSEATLLASDVAEIERRWLAVEAEVALTHPEHDTITLAPGTYEVRRQRELDDAGGITMVAD